MTAGLEVTARTATDSREHGIGAELLSPESQGWSTDAVAAAAKIAALASLGNLAPPDPVARVQYHSRGNALVIAAGDVRARAAAEALAQDLQVTLLGGEPPAAGALACWSGTPTALQGHLGDFNVTIAQLRTAADATVRAEASAKFDLVLDFSATSLFAMRFPPQGYFHAPAGEAALAAVLEEIRGAVGEFEKPRFFAYRDNLCAHSRSEVVGCTACIDICATGAISSDGDHVKVDPHLCMGCGTCATVCPSGAMSYQYPRVADRGVQMKQLLSAYRAAGGSEAAIVFHNAEGRELLQRANASDHGLPARVLPLESWSVGPIGLDLLLPAIAFGASQVFILVGPMEDRDDVAALRAQMAIGQTILHALGYAGRHFAVLEAFDGVSLERAFAEAGTAQAVAVPATFLLGNDKRTAIEFAVEHLVKHAATQPDVIAMPDGAPWGEVRVDRAKCTMCMACVGACPESALMDGRDLPLLKFLERNCVQCGLCESTCPEDAISLRPRLLLSAAVREARTLNETEPFHCTRCRKPFGTRQMVEAMVSRLAGHSMFAGGAALKRLQMCADCRVVDMMSSKDEVSVLRMGSDS